VSRREDAVVFLVGVTLLVDLDEGFKAFFVAGLGFAFVLEVVFAGLAVTFGSLTSFFTVVLFVVPLASLAAVSFLEAGFFVAEDFAALVETVVDLDLVAGLAGAFFTAGLGAFVGLF
jgi:hypothetical protein